MIGGHEWGVLATSRRDARDFGRERSDKLNRRPSGLADEAVIRLKIEGAEP
jgi:hypothetical protein